MDIKWDGYIEEPYYSEKLTLDLRNFEDCLTATKDIDYVYNLAANMGSIGFITTVGAEVMHDNVLINTNMLQASVENKVKRFFFSSSACVYPTYRQTDPDVTGLKEEDAYPADPDKRVGRKAKHVRRMAKGMETDLTLALRLNGYCKLNKPGN